MFKIVKKRELNPTVTEMVIEAPLIAKKAKAGQFIIIRAKEDSERIPLTIAHYDAAAGTVAIIFQIVGAGTMQLNSLKEGEYVHDLSARWAKQLKLKGSKMSVWSAAASLRHCPARCPGPQGQAPRLPASSASVIKTLSSWKTNSAPAVTS